MYNLAYMSHKLLLADDSVTIQRVIELTFADEDIQVIAVGDGKQAIDRVQQDRPDIVLADIGMPERDGYEVASFIKADPQLSHIPVLLLTGAFEPIDESRARTVGCDGVLVKPFEPQMVINRVRDLLSGRRPAGLWSGGQSQAPARPAAPAASNVDIRQAAAAAASTGEGGSLENYFDRLDAAFGGKKESTPEPLQVGPAAPASASPVQQQEYGYRDPVTAAPSGPMPINVSEWDPELTAEPARAAKPDPVPAVSNTQAASAVDSWNPDLGGAPAPAPPGPARAALPNLDATTPPEPAAVAPSTPAAVPQMPRLAEVFAALLSAERGQPVVPSAHRAATMSDDQVDAIVKRVIDRMGDPSIRRTVLDVAERLVREEIEKIKSK